MAGEAMDMITLCSTQTMLHMSVARGLQNIRDITTWHKWWPDWHTSFISNKEYTHTSCLELLVYFRKILRHI